MKINLTTPNIPILENPVIALKIDLKKKKEHIIIGEFDNVNRYIRGWKKDKIIFEQTRPIGSFMLDITDRTKEFYDISSHLYQNICKKPQHDISIFESLYAEDNPAIKFLTLKLWKEYESAINKFSKGNDYEDFFTNFDELTFPFRYDLMQEVLRWQGFNIMNPLSNTPYEYYEHPVQKMLVPNPKGATEYLVSDRYLHPLILWYLKIIYENKKYFSYCKVCKKLFLAPDAGKTVMCSDKCRKKQQQINKKKYDADTKEIDYEKAYRNENMYWYNRVNKAKKKCSNQKAIEAIEKLYNDHKKIATEKKRQVKNEKLSYGEFDNWLLDERNSIDDIMEEYGMGKYE